MRPERWGSGLGTALHDAALAAIRRRGHTRCQLEVLEENARARRFYERRGWRQDDRRRTAEFPPHPVAVAYAIDLSLLPLEATQAGIVIRSSASTIPSTGASSASNASR